MAVNTTRYAYTCTQICMYTNLFAIMQGYLYTIIYLVVLTAILA